MKIWLKLLTNQCQQSYAVELKMKERPFEKWEIDRFYAKSPDLKYRFWITNGYFFFKDEGKEQLLSLLSFCEKFRVWRELKKEMRIRVTELLDVPPIKGVE